MALATLSYAGMGIGMAFGGMLGIIAAENIAGSSFVGSGMQMMKDIGSKLFMNSHPEQLVPKLLNPQIMRAAVSSLRANACERSNLP